MTTDNKFDAMRYGPIGKAVDSVMPHTEADPVGVLAATLALYSSALNGHVMMDNGRPVVVWTVLAGRSLRGRKGYALNTTRKLLAGTIGRFIDTHTYSGISSGPSLVNMMWAQELETAGTETGADGRTLVIEEEWAGQLRTSKRDPKFTQLLRMVWDGKTVANTTIKETKVVEQPLMGFHCHITPGEWAKYVGGATGDALGGSFNRILPVLVEKSKRLPHDHVEVIKESKALTAAYKWAQQEPRYMSLAPDAGARYDELRGEIEDKLDEMPERISCFLERSAEQIVRIAAVYTAAERKTVISRKAIEAAWAFVAYSMTSVEKLVNEMDQASPKAVKTLPEKIREKLTNAGGEMTATLIQRAIQGVGGIRLIEAAANTMPDVEVVMKQANGQGRPAKVFRMVKEEAEVTPEPETEPKAVEEPKAKPKKKQRKLTVVSETRPAGTRRAPTRRAPKKSVGVDRGMSSTRSTASARNPLEDCL